MIDVVKYSEDDRTQLVKTKNCLFQSQICELGVFDTGVVDTSALDDLQVSYQLLGTGNLPESSLTAQIDAQLVSKSGLTISSRLATWLIRN